MIVARLKAWLRRLLAPLRAGRGVRAHSATAAQRHTRPLVATVSASPYRSGLACGTWMEDARRLRAQPETRLGSSAPSRENVRQIMHGPHWAAAYNASQTEHFPRSAPAAESREGELQLRRSESASRPLASSAPQEEPDSGALSSLRERRRMVYVRELVRRGIYNEGFTPGTMPDQYRPRQQNDADTEQPPQGE